MTGILGKKLGMTQIFTEDGKICPVTVVEAGPCCVIFVRTLDNNGYNAAQIGFVETEEKKLTKSMAGVFKGTGVKPYRILKEFPMSGLKVGEFVTVGKFTKGEKVTTKNLEIVEVRIDQNLLLIKGSVPGSTGSYLEIKKRD